MGDLKNSNKKIKKLNNPPVQKNLNFTKKIKKLSVLRSASVERFSVSHMRDFKKSIIIYNQICSNGNIYEADFSLGIFIKLKFMHFIHFLSKYFMLDLLNLNLTDLFTMSLCNCSLCHCVTDQNTVDMALGGLNYVITN